MNAPEQLSLGSLLRLSGMARADDAESDGWKQAADDAIRSFIWRGWRFTAEDVRNVAGSPTHENAMGARLAAWQRRGDIKLVGYRPATRASRRANRLAVWVCARNCSCGRPQARGPVCAVCWNADRTRLVEALGG